MTQYGPTWGLTAQFLTLLLQILKGLCPPEYQLHIFSERILFRSSDLQIDSSLVMPCPH